jgi:hypothetical protein
VPGNSRIGLHQNLIGEGLALRVTPDRQQPSESPIYDALNLERTGNYLLNPPKEPAKTTQTGMYVRTYNDPHARRSTLDNQYAINYLFLYVNYADKMVDAGKNDMAFRALDTLPQKCRQGKRGCVDYQNYGSRCTKARS